MRKDSWGKSNLDINIKINEVNAVLNYWNHSIYQLTKSLIFIQSILRLENKNE